MVAAANRTGLVYDVVFWGDSLTALVQFVEDTWTKYMEHWGPAAGWKTALLGVGGSRVEELMVSGPAGQREL